MLNESPPADLLVVGGLTVDRFADGTDAPGGSAIHAARAMAAAGRRVAVATAAGPEPAAAEGLAELRRVAAPVLVTDSAVTTVYRHREAEGARRLWLEALGGEVRLPAEPEAAVRCRAVLFAPVAGEVGPITLAAFAAEWTRVAILQGWLRRLEVGGEASPQPLSWLDPEVAAALGRLDLLVASREDLRAEAADPLDQLAALRRTVGDRPWLVVTDGLAGAWLGRGGLPEPQHVAVAVPVDDVPTVGAGDALAAHLAVALAGGTDADDAAFAPLLEDAMQRVSEFLATRRD